MKRIFFGIVSHLHILCHCFTILSAFLLMMKGMLVKFKNPNQRLKSMILIPVNMVQSKTLFSFVCRIGFAIQAGDIPLDWALGAFILQTSTETSQHAASGNLHWFHALFSNDSKTLHYLIGIPILMTVLVYLVSKWRKPQLKTIYDLEKGRYIVTRIR